LVLLDELLVRCRQGDPLAWEGLVRRYQGRVFGIALHYMRDREDARDVAQEIFIKMYQNLGRIRDAATFTPWLMRLSRNCCIDRIRGRNARPQEAVTGVEGAGPLASLDASPEESLLEDARRALLYRAMGTLSPTNREILLLKDIQQLQLEEIATLLDLPLGTVKSRSNRARIELARAVRSLEGAGAAS